MRVAYILFGLIGLSIVFTVWSSEHAPKYDIFLFSDRPIKLENLFYDLFQYAIIVIISIMWYHDAEEKNKEHIKVFIILTCLDAGDFLLTHNDPYIEKFPLSFNVVMTVTYLTYIIIRYGDSEGSRINSYYN